MILGVYMIIGMLIITGLVVIIDICWRGRKMNKKENLETKNLDDFVKPLKNQSIYCDPIPKDIYNHFEK